MGTRDLASDRQAEPRARAVAACVAAAEERLEDALAVALGDARPVVRDRDLDGVVVRSERDAHLPARRTVAQGVLEEVPDHALEVDPAREDRGRRPIDDDPHVTRIGGASHPADRALHDVARVDVLSAGRVLRAEPSEREEVLGEGDEPAGRVDRPSAPLYSSAERSRRSASCSSP